MATFKQELEEIAAKCRVSTQQPYATGAEMDLAVYEEIVDAWTLGDTRDQILHDICQVTEFVDKVLADIGVMEAVR